MTRRIPPDISETPFDAVVIGAGINGAGIARDAAMRGLRVLLLDKGDVASGTSSWSTRLIHGGLRYLEHGELWLVRESLGERETLLRIAPHLVRPLPLLIPVYAGRRRGPLTVRAGMIAYDLLSFDKTLPRHRMLSRAEAISRAPALDPEGLRGAALYFDAQVEYAERLVVENALAARADGATVLTYARVRRVLTEGGAVVGVEFTDSLDGGTHTARAPLVVNVAGPWVDEILAHADGGFAPLIGGTKGSHVVVEKFPGAPADALYVEAREDARPFFVIPWDGKYLIGTTDTAYRGDLDRVEADEREIAYLIGETNRVIPRAALARESVLYTYAGVRPLPVVRAPSEAAVTRRHFVRDHGRTARGLFSVVGGKLTTYRNLARQVVDSLFRALGRAVPPCTTARAPLPGAAGGDFDAFGEKFKAECGLPAPTAERLLKVYGVRAAEVLKLAGDAPDLREPFSAVTPTVGAEVVYAFERELAETLADCLLRRTMVGLNSHAGLDAVEGAARLAQKFLGWDDARARREVAAYREYVRRFHPRGLD